MHCALTHNAMFEFESKLVATHAFDQEVGLFFSFLFGLQRYHDQSMGARRGCKNSMKILAYALTSQMLT